MPPSYDAGGSRSSLYYARLSNPGVYETGASPNLERVSFSDGRDRIGMRRLGYELTLKSELGLIHI